jgi:small subunit ribosomal protein S13
MARISGIDIPIEKRIEVALTYVYGIGPALSKKILDITKIDPNTRVKDLKETEFAKIREQISELELPVEGELKRRVTQNIKRLQEIKSYRGLRHKKGLPVRGQRTRSNARTRKGKKKTVGGLKRKITKT